MQQIEACLSVIKANWTIKAGVVFSQPAASSGTVLVISGNKPITYFVQDPLGLNEKHW